MPLVSLLLFSIINFAILFGASALLLHVIGKDIAPLKLVPFVVIPSTIFSVYTWAGLVMRAWSLEGLEEFLKEHPEYEVDEEDLK